MILSLGSEPCDRPTLRIALVLARLLLAGCATPRAPVGAAGALQVVAAENFWGSIAAQLAGDRADVTSIITNPATDPHDYEPTPHDARRVATGRST